MTKTGIKLDEIITELEQQRHLLTLAFEETNAAGTKLDVKNHSDLLKAFKYAERAEIMQALIDSVDSALMFIIDELDDLNHEDAA